MAQFWKHGDIKVSEKREMWMKILEGGKAAPSFKDWYVEEEEALAKLEAKPVSINETTSGCCLKEQHKHKLLATIFAMSDKKSSRSYKNWQGRG